MPAPVVSCVLDDSHSNRCEVISRCGFDLHFPEWSVMLSIFLIYFIYLWLCWVFVSVRGLSSSCGKRGPLFIAVRGPLTIVASLVVEHRLQTRRLSNCGSRAQLLRGMWDLPRPGLEPVSPALAGRLWTTAPPGKPVEHLFKSFSTWKKQLTKWKDNLQNGKTVLQTIYPVRA